MVCRYRCNPGGRIMSVRIAYEISEEDICCTIGVDFAPYKLPIDCDCEEEE
jgi:hypothetical protein